MKTPDTFKENARLAELPAESKRDVSALKALPVKPTRERCAAVKKWIVDHGYGERYACRVIAAKSVGIANMIR